MYSEGEMDVNGWLQSRKSSSIFLLFGLTAFFPSVRLKTFFFSSSFPFACHYTALQIGGVKPPVKEKAQRRPLPTLAEMIAVSSQLKPFFERITLYLFIFIHEQHTLASVFFFCQVVSRLRDSYWQSVDFGFAESTKWSKSTMLVGLWGKHESRICVSVWECPRYCNQFQDCVSFSNKKQ